MILYKNDVGGFLNDVETDQIIDAVEKSFQKELGRKVSEKERGSLMNSLTFIGKRVRRAEINHTCGVLVEYIIPQTSKRVDFIITGEDKEKNKNFIIIELKQWQKAKETSMDGVVITPLGKGEHETSHPSYQAQSYKLFLNDFNENISLGNINVYSCAYLHNYKEKDPEPLKTLIYENLIKDTPIYFKDDYEKLENFLKKYVGVGNGEGILYQIEAGRIKPSKKLINHVAGVLNGNREFILLDEQKIAYERALHIAKTSTGKKSVLIIKGGPGTGKSVVSVNVLAGLLRENLNTIFVAPNASFRDVLLEKLSKGKEKNRLKNLFKGSSGFFESEENIFDVIVVDEAHRLKDKRAYRYKGENQVRDIIKAAKTSIFFIDDNQVIKPEDIGSEKEITRIAEELRADISKMELSSQFRCSGAEGYVNWINDVLHISQTGNFDGWDREDFEFKIFDNPHDVYESIKEKSQKGYQARLLAGYAWKWTGSKGGNKDAGIDDIEIPEHDFSMPWNSRKVGTRWAINEEGLGQIGCIHTSQGLEFDYVGVIVGNDLKFDPNKLKYYTEWSEYKDIKGKTGLKNDPEQLNRFIRNIYKVLLTRGMRGCYVYFRDKETEKFFRERLSIL